MKTPPHPKFNHPTLHLLESLPTTTSTLLFKKIHSHLITTGLAHHTYPLSRLLSRSPSPSYSLSLLSSSISHTPSLFLHNTLISTLSSRGHTLLSLHVYSLLPFPPNPHTYPSLLKACTQTPLWAPQALSLHAHIIKNSPLLHHDRFVLSSLLTFYSTRRRDLRACCHLFHRIQHPDLPAWNSLLTALSSFGSTSETLLHFRRMLPKAQPNEITLVAVIAACGHDGALAQGAWAHRYLLTNNLSMNRFVVTALIEMYSNCGRLDLARTVFSELPLRDTMCYNAMLKAFRIHGHGRDAMRLFDRMRTERVRVDEVTLVAVMSACAHAGMVEEGRRCFHRMGEDFGIDPRDEHYGCLVDLLGRAGRLEEAEKVVREMPMEPSAVVYRSLIGACRLHKDSEMGERAIACLLCLEPDHGGNYVLLSNTYADTNRWDDVRRVRNVMKERGIDKTPGSSLVELDGAIHEFVIGDKTHPCSKEIYAMLDEIGKQ